jgi:hypothetical protein
MTKSTRYFMTGSAAVVAAGLATGLVAYYGGGFQALMASTGPTELAYVPADATIVAYADVRSIMDSELRQRFKQAVPLNLSEEGQKEFYENTGINLEQDVDYVVAAMNAAGPIQQNGILVARGRFDVVKLEGLAREHGAAVEDYHGTRLLVLNHHRTHGAETFPGAPGALNDVANQGALAFLEPGLVGIGPLASVKRAIDAHNSAQSITSNDEMMNLVSTIERSNNAWAVGRFDLLTSQAKLPEQIARQIPPIKWFAAAGHINGGVSAQLLAEANDEQAAENLRGVVNGVFSLARLQGQNDPKLHALVNSFQMSGSGKKVQLSFTVPAEIFELMAPKVQQGLH